MVLPDITTRVFKPSDELRSCILQYIIMDIYAENYTTLKVKTFPTSLAGIGIGLHGSKTKFLNDDTNINQVYSSSVIGTYPIESKIYLAPNQATTRVVSAILSHEGINRLLGITLHEVCNSIISLDSLYGNELNLLTEELEQQKNDIDLIHCLDRFFSHKLHLSKKKDHQTVFRLINILNDTSTIFSVHKLASDMSMHSRTLERLFNANFGLPPKELLRIRRFILLKDQVLRNPQIHWADLILKCGFYDQAHMNHEISKVTNMTPIKFFKMARLLQKVATSHIIY